MEFPLLAAEMYYHTDQGFDKGEGRYQLSNP